MSNFGAWTEEDINLWTSSGRLKGRSTDFGMKMHGVMSKQQMRRNLQEQVKILVEAGVDFFIAEAFPQPDSGPDFLVSITYL